MEAERRARDETSGRGEALQAPPWRPMRFGNKGKLRLMKFLGKFTVWIRRIREMVHLYLGTWLKQYDLGKFLLIFLLVQLLPILDKFFVKDKYNAIKILKLYMFFYKI